MFGVNLVAWFVNVVALRGPLCDLFECVIA